MTDLEIERLKYADTEHPISELMRKRWSGRSYERIPLAESEVLTLIEAAHWAPSSMNEQPWRYYYALQGTPEFDEMWALLMDGNKPWVKNAGALILATGKTNFERSGQANRHYMHDVGAANAQLTLQATEMNLNVHMLGGYFHGQTIEKFRFSENEVPICFLAVGKRASASLLDEPFKTREQTERSRKPLGEISTKVSW
jgi:nitroreductase